MQYSGNRMSSQSLNNQIIANRFFLLIFLIALCVVCLSIFLEISGREPCKLCFFQRLTFSCISAISLIGLFTFRKNYISFGLCLISFISFGIGIYHLCIQLGFLNDPCYVEIPRSFDTFKENFFKSKISCSKIDFLFFGIPLSALSAIISAIFFFFSLSVLNNFKIYYQNE